MGEYQCYNRGCGMKFKSEDNTAASCRHHPGEPFFHDAYKGWSCCNKKCTDFTEFLNIKGCTLSMHSNVKPAEPERPVASNMFDVQVVEVKPIAKSSLDRPPYETRMVILKPHIAASFQKTLEAALPLESKAVISSEDEEISVGILCKNVGCNMTYEGPKTDSIPCVHHTGVPVFHEGLKFWSCCQKRTSDFNAFLNQVGCKQGTHLWRKIQDNQDSVQCRWDFHQTPTHAIVSIYAKQYCPVNSEIQMNPIRLFIKLIFPHQNDASFYMEHELSGIVDVANSQVTMYGTKVEIKMKKAEPGSWKCLEMFKQTHPKNIQHKNGAEPTLESKVDSVDLSDL